MRGRTAALYDMLLALSTANGPDSPPALPVWSIRSPEPFTHEIVMMARTPEDMGTALQTLAESLAPVGLSVAPLEAGWTDGATKWRFHFRVAPRDSAALPAPSASVPEVP